MSLSLDDLSDDDVNDLLDEIAQNDQDKIPELSQQNSIKILTESKRKRKLSRQLTFTALKKSVFAELDEQDFIDKERITWHKLKQWVEFEWFDKLYHDEQIKQHYLEDINKAKIDYKSYTDKILIKYFGCPCKTNNSHQFAQAFITNKTNDDAFVLFNFPYYFAKGLYHYVLFSRYDIINTLGPKQIKRLISRYIENDKCIKEDEYEFVYYDEREKLGFFCTEQYEFEKKERTPLLSEIVNNDIMPNIIHVFVMITSDYRVYLGANNATWADESFLWEEACSIITNKEQDKFGREEKWLRKYIQDRNKGKKKGKKATEEKEENEKKEAKQIGFNSVRDKILIKEFKCKSEINIERNKLRAIVDDTTPRLLWTGNLYPYFYQQGIEHNLIWYLDEKVEKNVLEDFIAKHIGDRMYIYWENPPHLKSIPDLDHYQIISVDMNEYMANIKHLLYVDKAYKWDTFVDIKPEGDTDTEYGWNERVCRRYLEEIEETKIRFNSLIDADLRRYFKCKLNKDEFGKFVVDNENDNDYGNYDFKKYVFVLDRYHFNLEQGLIQYLLIVRDKEKWNQIKIKQIIKAELASRSDLEENDGNKFVFWEKVQKEKQASNLWYYHVIYNNTL